jgi:tetratricopeptide (TPR) repeat protein
VLVAVDEELNREVALKQVLAERADDEDARRRFVREAEVTGRLEHPGIVPVYGLIEAADGRPAYAMRFIHGETLKSAIAAFHDPARRPKVPRQRLLALRGLLGRFVAVCNAVAYAHSRGIVHRDLKPDNVMLGPFGETLVVDWGLARPDAATSGPLGGSGQTSGPLVATQAGAVVGTPAYMAPEQAAGKPDVGPAADVYGLGAILYCMLTGKAPFTGGDLVDVLSRVVRGEYPSPSRLCPEAPPALAAVARKAMALRPEDRYATPLELAGDVERWLADEPVSVYREPILTRLARRARRRVVPLTILGLFLLLTTMLLPPFLVLFLVLSGKDVSEGQRGPFANLAKARRQQRNANNLREIGKAAAKFEDQHRALLPGASPDGQTMGEMILPFAREAPINPLLAAGIAVERDPRNPAAYTERARAYLALGMRPDAEADVGTALKLDPNHADAHALRGELRLAWGDRAGAREDLDRAVALDGRNPKARRLRARLFLETKEPARALEDADALVRLLPTKPEPYRLRARAHAALKNDAAARADLRTAGHLSIRAR